MLFPQVGCYLIDAKYSAAVMTGRLDNAKSFSLRVMIMSAFSVRAEKYCSASSKSVNCDCNACCTTSESTRVGVHSWQNKLRLSIISFLRILRVSMIYEAVANESDEQYSSISPLSAMLNNSEASSNHGYRSQRRSMAILVSINTFVIGISPLGIHDAFCPPLRPIHAKDCRV